MDESQSSDFFSETDMSCNNSMIQYQMDSIPYETFVSNTKTALNSWNRKEIQKPTFSVGFTSLLQDCQSCISQALDLIINILSDTDTQIGKVIEYLHDAISLLQLLSNFLKTVIETVSMACRSMKTFPLATCDIILKIFMHCKDSEYLYGAYLSNVEKELKDLFRVCHELQLTYLMIMEKCFVFDLMEEEDVEILIETLDKNLKIGKIAQKLDVKTMAEQWKAFTAICEKYSNTLMDKNVYNNCIDVLSDMLENNVITALETEQENKVILRSLKVASFSIKVLIKICNIFKHATLKNYQKVFELLLFIQSNNSAILEVDSERSPQFLNLMNLNVLNPTEMLFKELLLDIKFANNILDQDLNKLQSEHKLVAYVLIIMSMIKSTLQGDTNQCASKQKLIKTIYGLLRLSHAQMNMDYKFPTESKSSYETQGLYESLLSHFVAYVTTLSAEEFVVLERSMTESILGNDCMAALFSANTWSLLARVVPPHLLISQLTSLCRIYQKLEKNKLFSHSLQKINLGYTITCLFEVMQQEDKIKIYKLFNIEDEQNHNLWASLQINNLPSEIQLEVETYVSERMKTQLRKVSAGADISEVEKMIKILNLAGTFTVGESNIIDYLLKAWEKACPKISSGITGVLTKETLWYHSFVTSLVSSTVEHIYDLHSVHKILHVLNEIVRLGNTELKLAVINVVCKFITMDMYDANKNANETLLINLIKCLSQDTQNTVKYKLFSSLREFKDNPNLYKITAEITKDHSLKEIWNNFTKSGVLCKNNKWREQLALRDYEYRHKCIESNLSGELKKSCSNFELVDIDSLFDNESDSEQPVHKKMKLNDNEADAIISRLVNDVCSLSKLKNIYTSEQKAKIRCMYEQLRNICN